MAKASKVRRKKSLLDEDICSDDKMTTGQMIVLRQQEKYTRLRGKYLQKKAKKKHPLKTKRDKRAGSLTTFGMLSLIPHLYIAVAVTGNSVCESLNQHKVIVCANDKRRLRMLKQLKNDGRYGRGQ